MTRPNKRDLERAVNELDAPSAATADHPQIARLKEVVDGYPDCDLDAAIALLDDLPDAE